MLHADIRHMYYGAIIMNKICISLMLTVGLMGVISKAEAHDSFGLSINLGGPSYYAPPPSVYYAPPPVVYYRPAPVYYGPNAYFRFSNDDRWHRHREFRRGWDNHRHGHDH